MVSYYRPRHWPQDIMEHILDLRYYGRGEEARTKLLLVAKHVDDPDKLKQFEDEWLYGTDHTRSPWHNWWFD